MSWFETLSITSFHTLSSLFPFSAPVTVPTPSHFVCFVAWTNVFSPCLPCQVVLQPLWLLKVAPVSLFLWRYHISEVVCCLQVLSMSYLDVSTSHNTDSFNFSAVHEFCSILLKNQISVTSILFWNLSIASIYISGCAQYKTPRLLLKAYKSTNFIPWTLIFACNILDEI